MAMGSCQTTAIAAMAAAAAAVVSNAAAIGPRILGAAIVGMQAAP